MWITLKRTYGYSSSHHRSPLNSANHESKVSHATYPIYTQCSLTMVSTCDSLTGPFLPHHRAIGLALSPLCMVRGA